MFRFHAATLRRGLCALALSFAASAAPPAQAGEACVQAGRWHVPGSGAVSTQEVLAMAAKARVVLLGESHDDADNHRWQLQTAAALAGLRPRLILGFEMFPRRVQGALDRWIAGTLSEGRFLQVSDWSRVWSYDAGLYLPLFHFARMNKFPMLALNVERELVRAVGARGFDAIPHETREGVTAPAPAREHYLEQLFDIYRQHPEKEQPARTDAGFLRFVQAQQVWDRAMAQVLAEAAAREPDALVIGILGAKHVAHGDGVPYQLEDLGVKSVVSLLPWDADDDCAKLVPGLANAVFGIAHAEADAPLARPRLGVQIRQDADGVMVAAVDAGSIAEATGLQAGDVLIEVAGATVTQVDEVRASVGRMAPGTWLPLRVRRQGEQLEFIAKFPLPQ